MSEGGGIAGRWRELSGDKHWEGIESPLDPDLKKYLIHYGELTMATYDTFITETMSRFTGLSMWAPKDMFKNVGLQNRHKELMKYNVTKYLYATSSIDLPGFIKKSMTMNPFTRTSNWMGYVAITKDEGKSYLGRRDIVVAWRGTILPQEWSEDNDVAKVSAENVFKSNVMVHKGFLSVYTSSNPVSKFNKISAREQAIQEVQRLIGEHKGEDLSITVVGHSLGGALAHLFAADVVANGINKGDKPIPVTAFPFASPRVGDSTFKQLVDSLGAASDSPKAGENRVRAEPGGELRILRIVNKADMVPKVPPATVLGYTHVGQLFLINNLMSKVLNNPYGIVIAHNMEASYLHGISISIGTGTVLDGAQQDKQERDIALVNKYTDALKPEYFVPPNWWTPENKGMVQGKDGNWKMRLGEWNEKAAPSDADDDE